MSEPYVGEVKMFAFGFAPRGFAWCNGQLLPVGQNQALFALIGTTFGGNGTTTFALPDLRGRAPVHPGQGPGLDTITLGQSSGAESVTLNTSQMPQHAHLAVASGATASQPLPNGATFAVDNSVTDFFAASAPTLALAPTTVGMAGGNQPHTNMQPYSVTNFCIATVGIFPSRN